VLCTTGIQPADGDGGEPETPQLAVDIGFQAGTVSSAGGLLAARTLAAELGGELIIENGAGMANTWFRFRLPLSLQSWNADEEQVVSEIGSYLD